MSKEFTFSDPGEGLQEAEVLEIHVSAGDSVADGDTVLTVETDKANTDIPAPFSGTIEEVKVSEGDTAEVGDVLMTYNEGEEESEASSEDEDTGQAAKSEQSQQDEQDEGSAESGEKQKSDTDDQSQQSEEQSEPKKKSETETKSETKEQSADGSSGKKSDKQGQSKTDEQEGPVPAAPSTRRLAREKGVDLHAIEPSGKEGRVTAEDVEAAAKTAGGGRSESGESQSRQDKERQQSDALIPGGGPAPTLPDFSQWGEIERVPLRSIRRATAQNMAQSWSQIPHVYHQDIADVTDLERFRHEHEDAAEVGGGKFTLTVLVMKALASALKQFPRFNASLDTQNQEIVLKHYCHIGLAVATDRGLLVPVIRDVDQKTLIDLSTEAADIAQKTRNGEIRRDDMQGGSITVTNPGPMGGSSLTPLINHPQVGILGMGQTRLEPVVHGSLDDYAIKPRLRLPLILGFDHRVNDGAEAAKFVTHLVDTLADPESLLLNL